MFVAESSTRRKQMLQVKSVTEHSGTLYQVIPLLRELAEFEKMAADFAPSEVKLREQINRNANPTLRIQLAYDYYTPVGVVVYYIGDYSSFKTRWNIYLEDVFVKETHRGQGLLRRLLKPVAELALLRGTEVIFSVLDWNKNAIAAYKRLGATEAGYKVDGKGAKWLTMVFRDKALEALAG